ncbi:peptidase M50 [Acuticoccus sediminis]|uniref:peptidase M50 n=1 Tax=Acuticoccus sediminis TaxID=2184697 RepID=UPI001CFEAB97|nr:peptidase M50 [Acuticoccus sediminis]
MAAEKRLHSPNWFRVAELKLRLRNHVRLHRTHYRGTLWYVLQDRTSGRFHRFTPAAYFFISLLDGTRTTSEAWDIACEALAAEALAQDDVIRLLATLHHADVLVGDVPPDIEELAERGRKGRSRARLMRVINPLAIRIPVLDPDGFLRLTLPLVRPILSVAGLVAWALLVLTGIALAAVHWGELTHNVLDRVLSLQNIALILVAYPAIKAIHELGHAYMIKRFGGEVHEIGVMLLVFLPVPYVDASDSLSFPQKWKRALVAAAGILAEMAMAAVAMIVWTGAEAGVVRAFAFNVMLIGGVSTVFFNGNPLLRFDGYFVLSDLVEIPNLARRANLYIGYWVQTRILGAKDVRNPATAPGEAGWFVFYAVAAFLYRLMIFSAVILFVATKFFVVGVVMALWALTLMFVVPVVKWLGFLFTSPVLNRTRGRALARLGAVVAVVAFVLLAIPLPFATMAEGVVTTPSEGRLVAEVDGTVAEVLVAQGAEVASGAPVLRLADPLLAARVALLEATVVERQARYDAVRAIDPGRARVTAAELAHAREDLALAKVRMSGLMVRARTGGQVALPGHTDLVGRAVRKGDVVGFVSPFVDPVVATLIPEADADLVRTATRRVEMRFVTDPATVHDGTVTREVPGLTATLPSLALATVGGGRIVLDPARPVEEARALQNFLALEVQPPAGQPFEAIGARVMLRFVHAPTPIAVRVYRRARQIFLSTFSV